MFSKGLKGIVAAETMISQVDGEKGELLYRGYEIKNLVKGRSFEEISYLLWYGELPTPAQLTALKNELIKNRYLHDHTFNILTQLPAEMDLMSVIRTCISSEGLQTYGWKPTIEQAIRLTSMVPLIISYRTRLLRGQEIVSPSTELGHVANYLYMLEGKQPSVAHCDALEMYMILTLEHGMNASTFTARVTASTESEMVSSITSAIGTMKGPLHGGAPAGVLALLEEIDKSEDSTLETIRKKIIRGERLMGFGHRVYKTIDPRSQALKTKLMDLVGEDRWLDLAIEVEYLSIKALEELKPGRALYTNVEFYAAAIMKAINFDSDLFTPTFTASRVVGWSAHVLEQAENNTIFRPESIYIGSRH
ncbi:citrate synthase/methylcitrate synthase [Bacillus sp. PS06]|uniref:citrate synthase/methylcitrate synthase n=1 Tax=Bacillus sp. PS06 TaxID=2764176 RepID=UPI0017802E3F|nr:citrate synthase/methylcitrate synthase [Bacillus sp. PS06]MBD8069028.1 citrate synthase/methylcitrate synthase [Bacillus sp. PS06]